MKQKFIVEIDLPEITNKRFLRTAKLTFLERILKKGLESLVAEGEENQINVSFWNDYSSLIRNDLQLVVYSEKRLTDEEIIKEFIKENPLPEIDLIKMQEEYEANAIQDSIRKNN